MCTMDHGGADERQRTERSVTPQPARIGKDRRQLPSWRWEELRTTLWVIPSILVVVSVLLFIATFEIDVAAYHGHLTLPAWIRTGNADAERQVLIAIAAAVITVIGVVFSITILALTLASQQFGPRMMRNFVRDIGNQVTLGSLRRDLRLLGAGPGLHQQPELDLRPPSLDVGRRSTPPASTSGC